MVPTINTTPDGRRYNVREIQPSDREHLARGVENMSVETRYQRFHTNRTHLSEPELDFLVGCDGKNHIAVVCHELDDQGEEGDGFAVARFFRSDDEPQWGEAAIVVMDDWQGQGIGEVLLSALAARCREENVVGWIATVGGDNQRALHVFEKFGVVESRVWHDRTQELRIRLGAP